MLHTPVLDAKGKETGIYAYNGQAANRALELIGKELGMFIDRSEELVWDGGPAMLTDAQLETLIEKFEVMRATMKASPAPPMSWRSKPIPFLVTPADETFGQFSPDTKWIAYSSDESRRREVYVQGFVPDHVPAAGVGERQNSTAGGISLAGGATARSCTTSHATV